VSEKLPSKKEALIFLNKVGCSKEVINHCLAVARLALKIAINIQNKGIKVNLALIEIGAILHDVGRSITHTVDHAVIGGEIANKAGLSESIISIIQRHVGGGITQDEAKKLGWKKDIYVPFTIEEKIVSVADKLIEKSKRAPIENAIQKLIEEKKIAASNRVRKLYDEIITLAGDIS
jgi:uncharacterized protein